MRLVLWHAGLAVDLVWQTVKKTFAILNGNIIELRYFVPHLDRMEG